MFVFHIHVCFFIFMFGVIYSFLIFQNSVLFAQVAEGVWEADLQNILEKLIVQIALKK